ncbi:MAG: M48 family peptidase [Betaproteobacteria bacterium]|nr:M48 family peptidase [Betaproteobacteria bacterium]
MRPHRLAQRSFNGLRVLALVAIVGLAPAALRADGIELPPRSRVADLVPAEQLERQAAFQYERMRKDAESQRALAPEGHPKLLRLQNIAKRLLPHAARYNERASSWRWEVSLIGSQALNAFAMPGGKIAFFTGIIDRLQLTDDEIAFVMGHEIAHALREHGRERQSKAMIAQGLSIGASILSQVMGYGDIGGQVARGVSNVTMLKFSRDDESEADLLGMDLSARAGYDPSAGISLWEKMSAAPSSQGAPPQWLSTHPSHESRIADIRKALPKVLPLYERSKPR